MRATSHKYSVCVVVWLLSLLILATWLYIIFAGTDSVAARQADEPLSEVCIPLTGVDVTGPTQGIVGVQYTFPVSITPLNATPPFTYMREVMITISMTEQLLSKEVPTYPTMSVYTTIHPIKHTWKYSGAVEVGIIQAYNACGGPVEDFHNIHITSKRFTFAVKPSYQQIPFGGTAFYNLETKAYTGFTETVVLTASNVSSDLSFQWGATEIAPGSSTSLTVTHYGTETVMLPGLWRTIPMTATGGNITWKRSIRLLIGGSRIYLPVLVKSSR